MDTRNSLTWFSFKQKLALLVISLLISMVCIGCSLLGAAARAIPQHVKAAYSNLGGCSVAVMVSADQAIRIDHPSIVIDATRAIQAKFLTAQKELKPKELEKTTFPHKPESIVKFQRDHPETEVRPAVEIAPALGVDRLVYVEITQFSTRSESAMQLYRGTITANLRVVEVKDGKAKVAHEQNDIRVVFPRHSPTEGILNANPNDMYIGTINFFAIEIAQKFYEHDVEEEIK